MYYLIWVGFEFMRTIVRMVAHKISDLGLVVVKKKRVLQRMSWSKHNVGRFPVPL